MGVLRFNRRSSIVRQLLRIPETWVGAAVAGLSVLCLVIASGRGAVATLLLGLLWGLLRGPLLVAKAFTRSFATCVAIQHAAVQRERPDVVVGSSWGGRHRGRADHPRSVEWPNHPAGARHPESLRMDGADQTAQRRWRGSRPVAPRFPW